MGCSLRDNHCPAPCPSRCPSSGPLLALAGAAISSSFAQVEILGLTQPSRCEFTGFHSVFCARLTVCGMEQLTVKLRSRDLPVTGVVRAASQGGSHRAAFRQSVGAAESEAAARVRSRGQPLMDKQVVPGTRWAGQSVVEVDGALWPVRCAHLSSRVVRYVS